MQVQGKQMLDKRNVCFSKGVALLEKPLPRDGIMPTKLYCKNANVDAENSAHLAKLPGAPGEGAPAPSPSSFMGSSIINSSSIIILYRFI